MAVAAPKKTPHLKDLFKTGDLVTIPVVNPDDPENPINVEIWIRKPTTSQHDEALTKGRSAAARRRNQFRDKESDLYISVMEQVNAIETKTELAEKILSYEDQKLHQQAYHEVMFPEVDEDDDENEPRWGKDGQHYMDLLTAVRDRYEEILKHNEELTPDEQHLRLSLETDEELARLAAEQEEFQKDVEERYELLKARELAKWTAKSNEDLRATLHKRMVELDVGAAFYQEYKSRLIYFSCRYPDDKDRLYWDSPDEIWEQPQFVQSAILNAIDTLEMGQDDLKNSLSLLSS